MKAQHKISLLASLYVSQGIPYGFFTQALPVLLRQHNISLAAIGLTSLLSLTWAFKFLWSPLVDQFGSNRFGYRKSWIVPLQLMAVSLLLLASLSDPRHAPMVIVFVAFMANLIAATQDVATDALAIDLLTPEERGVGNGVQIAGYRVGMILGGGVVLMVFDRFGWMNTYWLLSLMLLAGVVPVGLYREPPRLVQPEMTPVRHRYVALLLASFRRPQMGSWLVVLITYKAGDALGSTMLQPFLVDRGMQMSEIGWMLGTVGFSAGLVGAVVGGLVINWIGRTKSVVVFGLIHMLSMGLYALSAAGLGTEGWIYGFCAGEYFAGSLASVALFTQMMDRSRSEASATDYTVQASTLALATSVVGSTSGFLAQSVGYTMLFILAAVVGLAGVAVFVWIHQAQRLDGKGQ
jgi:MFS transporter, PAT family, beta-lactamase induction signal transducer AmpG